MKRFALIASLLIAPVPVLAQDFDPVAQDVLEAHIMPRFTALAQQSQLLAKAAQTDCTATSVSLRAAYNDAFDAWVSASHLRFGPTEVDDRAFALAFWPDSRGATPRTLANLIAEQDPIAESAEAYADMSIAARGFYALEFLLYDDTLMSMEPAGYHCQLVQTVSADIAATSAAILKDWEDSYSTTLLSPAPDGTYRSDEEVLQELFKSLTTGLEFTSDTRLGRPLGTFDKPHPNRAEARRSGRSKAHVALSLMSLQDLAGRLAAQDDALVSTLDHAFETANTRLASLDDPVFAGVAEPQSRLRVEVVQQAIDAIRATVREQLGPTLGVAAGFNALDGD